MKRNILTFFLGCIPIPMMLILSCNETKTERKDVKKIIEYEVCIELDSLQRLERASFNQGFEHALTSVALLNLELDIKGEWKTFEQMFEILRKRNGIPEPKK